MKVLNWITPFLLCGLIHLTIASKVEEDEGVVKDKLPNEGTKEKKNIISVSK